MKKMDYCKEEKLYTLNNKREFNAIRKFKEESIEQAFSFSYDMSFGKVGEHREYRSGGDHVRKNGEIFINTFQGKLGELGFYNECYARKIALSKPDFKCEGKGVWDEYDFKIGETRNAVKSSKYYSNLLLLEVDDFTDAGVYKPNIGTENEMYDYFILTRIYPAGDDLMKHNELLYSNEVDKEKLKKIILSKEWSYDIAGYISIEQLREMIKKEFIIKKGEYLGSLKTKLDADNFYIQSGDMENIEKLYEILKNK